MLQIVQIAPPKKLDSKALFVLFLHRSSSSFQLFLIKTRILGDVKLMAGCLGVAGVYITLFLPTYDFI